MRVERATRNPGGVCAAAILLVVFGGCSSTAPPTVETSTGTPRAASHRPPAGEKAPCGTRPTASKWRHIVWIVMENKAYDQIIGNPAAPYENDLAERCGLATAYRAVAHPSLPNYIALTSGATQGIVDDDPPSVHPLASPSIFSQLGSDWKSLQESMPNPCDLGSSGTYAVKHNPAAYFTKIRRVCGSRDVPLGPSPDLSAKFTLLTPNLCHDMHDCPVETGDRWLTTFLPKVLASPEYAEGSTAVFVTYDEDDGSADNHVATLVIAPPVPAGARSPVPFTHYSLLRTTEELLGLSTLGAAREAPSMRTAFGL
jgi:phosphatidylinositol-3-phosphatase